MTAGAIGYPWRRFAGVTVLAGVSWAGLGVLLGAGAGHLLGSNPLLAAVVGMVVGALLGA